MEPITDLNHPAVQASKAYFERNMASRNARQSIGFDDWFEMFKADCISLTAMGEEAGVSRERVRQIYNKYFRSFFGNRAGMDRKKSCTIERRAVKAVTAENAELNDGAVKIVAEMAKSQGLSVSARLVMEDGHPTGRVYSGYLMINGFVCVIHVCNSGAECSPPPAIIYAKANVSLGKAREFGFQIVYIDIPGFKQRIFIVPNWIFVKVWGESGWAYRSAYIAMSEGRRVYRARKFNFEPYENAWHLLSASPCVPVWTAS